MSHEPTAFHAPIADLAARREQKVRHVRAGAPVPDSGYHAAGDVASTPFDCAAGVPLLPAPYRFPWVRCAVLLGLAVAAVVGLVRWSLA